MGFAKHLAVADVCGAALAPRGNVVGIHILEVPNFGMIGIVADSTQGAIGFAFLPCSGRLLGVHSFLGGFVKR